VRFATVSPDKKNSAIDLGASRIDYRANSVEQYMADYTGGKGFDIVYDTVGQAAEKVSVRRARLQPCRKLLSYARL
jgi:NADPH:quinone reductase-like Zn-dependent oxidoreductase